MPSTYEESQLHDMLQPLIQESDALLRGLKSHSDPESLATRNTILFFSEILHQIDEIAKKFNKEKILQTTEAMSLLKEIYDLKNNFSTTSLQKKHPSLPYAIFKKIEEKVRKYHHFSIRNLEEYFIRKKERILSLTSPTGYGAELYDDFVKKIIQHYPKDDLTWPNENNQTKSQYLAELFRTLHTELFAAPFDSLSFYFSTPEAKIFLDNLVRTSRSLPDELSRLIPFYHPDAILFDTEKEPLLSQALVFFVPETQKSKLVRINHYRYHFSSEKESDFFDLSTEYRSIRHKLNVFLSHIQTKVLSQSSESSEYTKDSPNTPGMSQSPVSPLFFSTGKDSLKSPIKTPNDTSAPPSPSIERKRK